MLRPCFKTIEIQGFRSFGAEPQVAEIDAPIAAIWGPNSKGKTSFAEAVEFLLTGQTVKRQLLASRQDEFAGALRNAHIGADVEAYVSAAIECLDGQVRVFKRKLDSDYSKQHDCQSTLTIDGAPATNDDLTTHGIILAQPPLRAPVLAQHTLNYLFTVRPTDRSSYFKALLEVTDLYTFREEVASLDNYLAAPDDPPIEKLEKAQAIPVATPLFLLEDWTDLATLQKVFGAVAGALLKLEGVPVPATLNEKTDSLEEQLDAKRSKTFPLDLLTRNQFSALTAPNDDDWRKLEDYIEEREKVDEETRNLTALFKTLLKIPAVSDAEQPQDCPVCETEDALTPERIQVLRDTVAASDTFVQAEADALTVLRQIQSNLVNLQNNINLVLPKFLRSNLGQRRAAGFTIDRINALLGDNALVLVPLWVATLRPLLKAHRNLVTQCVAVKHSVDDFVAAPIKLEDLESFRGVITALQLSESALSDVDAQYKNATQPLYEALKTVIDSQGDTEGWQEFIELARDLPTLREAVVEQAVRTKAKSEIVTALKLIDKAIEAVLDTKFGLLTGAIDEWWKLLRGGEPTFFSAVKRRGKATIDFKGGLSLHEDQSSPKIRDVIAVFSDSQLHCLGMAIFLARAEHYGMSFVVLDDPVLTSDEDYKIHFRTRVIGRLHELGIQTIILTQHKVTRQEIATAHDHHGVDQFHIDIPDHSIGSVVSKTSDEFSAMLASAAAYTNDENLDIRRTGGKKLRIAAERFCKMLLVKKRREGGDETAAISDYQGKMKMLGGADGLAQLGHSLSRWRSI